METQQPQYNIAIVDDQHLFAEAFEALVKSFYIDATVRVYRTGNEFLKSLSHSCPEIVFMDIDMKGLNGFQSTQKALEVHPQLKVIAVTSFKDRLSVNRMFKTGAVGYFTKNTSAKELKKVFKVVRSGKKYIMPELAVDYTLGVLNDSDEKDENREYSDREIRMIELIAAGKIDKEIAGLLGISTKTVEAEKKKITQRMGVKKATEIVSMAYKLKILPVIRHYQ